MFVCQRVFIGSSLIALLLLLPTLLQSVRTELLPLKAYTVADGLAHHVINKIVRDSRGFLLSKQILPLSQGIDLKTLTPDPLPAIFQSTNTLAASVYSLQTNIVGFPIAN
jgi:hypothetical protein